MKAKKGDIRDLDPNLSYEHLAHIFRFWGLEKFNREAFERQLGYLKWKAEDHRLQKERNEKERGQPWPEAKTVSQKIYDNGEYIDVQYVRDDGEVVI